MADHRVCCLACLFDVLVGVVISDGTTATLLVGVLTRTVGIYPAVVFLLAPLDWFPENRREESLSG